MISTHTINCLVIAMMIRTSLSLMNKVDTVQISDTFSFDPKFGVGIGLSKFSALTHISQKYILVLNNIDPLESGGKKQHQAVWVSSVPWSNTPTAISAFTNNDSVIVVASSDGVFGFDAFAGTDLGKFTGVPGSDIISTIGMFRQGFFFVAGSEKKLNRLDFNAPGIILTAAGAFTNELTSIALTYTQSTAIVADGTSTIQLVSTASGNFSTQIADLGVGQTIKLLMFLEDGTTNNTVMGYDPGVSGGTLHTFTFTASAIGNGNSKASACAGQPVSSATHINRTTLLPFACGTTASIHFFDFNNSATTDSSSTYNTVFTHLVSVPGARTIGVVVPSGGLRLYDTVNLSDITPCHPSCATCTLSRNPMGCATCTGG